MFSKNFALLSAFSVMTVAALVAIPTARADESIECVNWAFKKEKLRGLSEKVAEYANQAIDSLTPEEAAHLQAYLKGEKDDFQAAFNVVRKRLAPLRTSINQAKDYASHNPWCSFEFDHKDLNCVNDWKKEWLRARKDSEADPKNLSLVAQEKSLFDVWQGELQNSKGRCSYHTRNALENTEDRWLPNSDETPDVTCGFQKMRMQSSMTYKGLGPDKSIRICYMNHDYGISETVCTSVSFRSLAKRRHVTADSVLNENMSPAPANRSGALCGKPAIGETAIRDLPRKSLTEQPTGAPERAPSGSSQSGRGI